MDFFALYESLSSSSSLDMINKPSIHPFIENRQFRHMKIHFWMDGWIMIIIRSHCLIYLLFLCSLLLLVVMIFFKIGYCWCVLFWVPYKRILYDEICDLGCCCENSLIPISFKSSGNHCNHHTNVLWIQIKCRWLSSVLILSFFLVINAEPNIFAPYRISFNWMVKQHFLFCCNHHRLLTYMEFFTYIEIYSIFSLWTYIFSFVSRLWC